jgi:hypothetical protein
MDCNQLSRLGRYAVAVMAFAVLAATSARGQLAATGYTPVPLLRADHPVHWWFVFKPKSATFPGCGSTLTCRFGGEVQDYKYGLQFAYASSEDGRLQPGSGCAGNSLDDPIGATFDQIYRGSSYYVIWNDQLFDDPQLAICPGGSCGSPWGHSKGVLSWNDAGEGFVMRVTTPSWPAAGNSAHPRQTDGNTLGCIKDNNARTSQDFFALKLSRGDTVKVLQALGNASVVTDPNNPQIANIGGPAEIQNLVKQLGRLSSSTNYSDVKLSSGVRLISKPSGLQVPPWPLVSAVLGGPSIKAATWFAPPYMPEAMAESLKPLAEELGIAKLNFQGLRRTMATRAQNLGSVKDIQSHLRHSRADTTANEYMQELPESVQLMVGTVYAMLISTAAQQQGA